MADMEAAETEVPEVAGDGALQAAPGVDIASAAGETQVKETRSEMLSRHLWGFFFTLHFVLSILMLGCSSSLSFLQMSSISHVDLVGLDLDMGNGGRWVIRQFLHFCRKEIKELQGKEIALKKAAAAKGSKAEQKAKKKIAEEEVTLHILYVISLLWCCGCSWWHDSLK